MNGLTLALTTPGGGGSSPTVSPTVCESLDCLPVIRWASSAGSITSRNDGILGNYNPFSWVNNIQANLTGMLTNMGNGLWSAAAFLSNGADPQKVLKTAGPMANDFAGRIYNILFDTRTAIPFIAIPILITVVIGLVAAYGRQGWAVMMKRIGALCLGLGMVFAMGATSAAHPKDAYPMTPYWMVSTVQDIVSKAGSGIASSFTQQLENTGTMVANGDDPNHISCRRYVSVLNATAAANGKDALAGSVNVMWEETGLRIWMRSTYGPGSNANNVFCRVLEYRAGASALDMRDITSAGAEGAGSFAEQGIAFWPSLMSLKTTLTGGSTKDNPADTNDQMLDRYVMLYNACGLDGKGNWYARPGFKFLGAIEGGDRKKAGYVDRPDGNAANLIPDSCRAAFTGSDGHEHPDGPGDVVDYYAVTGSGDKAVVVSGNGKPKYDSDGNPDPTTGSRINGSRYAQRQDVANLIKLFDVDTATSDWQQLVQKYGGGTYRQRMDAMQTILQQHGEAGKGDILAGILFVLSGLVALVVWGLCCGLLKILAMAVASFLAGGGVYLGFLILAFAPDKGKKAVMNAFWQCCAWIAGPTLVALFSSTGAMFVNMGMSMMNVIGMNGETTGGTVTLSLATLILPIAYLKLVQYLCVKVWRIGDPLSLPGLAQLAGFGGAMKTGLKMAAGGIAGGAAAMLAGGGIGAALSSAGRAIGSGGHMGVMQAASSGWNAGQWDSHYNGGRKGVGRGGAPRTGDHRESDADRAAGQPDLKPAVNGTTGEPAATGGTRNDGGTVETDRIPKAPVITASAAAAAARDGDTAVMPENAGNAPASDTPENGGKPYLDGEGKPVVDQATGRPFTFTQGELNHATRRKRGQLRRELYAGGLRGLRLQKELDGRMDPAHNIGIWDDIRHDAQNLHDASIKDSYRRGETEGSGGFGLNPDRNDARPEHHPIRRPEWMDRTITLAKDTRDEIAGSRVGQFAGRNMDRAGQWAAAHPKAATLIAGATALAVPGAAPLAVAAAIGGTRTASALLNPDSKLSAALKSGREKGGRLRVRASDAAGTTAAGVKDGLLPVAHRIGEIRGARERAGEQKRLVNRVSTGHMAATGLPSFTPAARPARSSETPVRTNERIRIRTVKPKSVDTPLTRLPLNPKPYDAEHGIYRPVAGPADGPQIETSMAIRRAGSRDWKPEDMGENASTLPDEKTMSGMDAAYGNITPPSREPKGAGSDTHRGAA
ncbi:hypothetical protein [Bifidobacterium sp. SO1]|uniref:hypothetical protein n=1 Tax=Bifidobacterium sp. SO1 TaxID=2809029 RepID=UPI001BDDBDA8|nr:hypothetical protein [Bifidobacterium sp. SO1]MBT1161773.1 hypothetical protein [Bifidobacterium sp. SO1]